MHDIAPPHTRYAQLTQMLAEVARRTQGMLTIAKSTRGLLSACRGIRNGPSMKRRLPAKFRRTTAPLIGERAADDLLRSSLAALDGEEDAPQALLTRIGRACNAVVP